MTVTPRLLGGRYELGGPLGRGGMAQVFRARDTRLGREVAVKQLRVDLAGDPTFQARFRREAQAAAGLNHPNIVAVYDTGEEVDPATGISVPYIVMELVEGHTLRDILRGGRKILPQRALEFTQGVLDALSFSHRAGIVHRDLKPANVMLTPNGTVKVMDFGIARAVADTSATMTQTAAVIGTAQYLSPEQARGETVDARSDIYSAGVLMYELLVGKPPFHGDSPVSVAYQHVRENPVPPSRLDSLITPAMDAIVLKALAKDPAHRYQTAAAMRADIGRLLAGQPVTASSPTVAAAAAAPTVALATTPPPPPASAATMVVAADSPPTQSGQATRAIQPVPPRRNLAWLWGLLAFLLVIGAGVGAYYALNPSARVEMVVVPNVYSARSDVAQQTLTEAKLVPMVENIVGPDDNTVDTVIKQTPTGGIRVPAGSSVTIQVNVGPKKETIPADLVGKQLDAVKKTLAGLGFTNVKAQADSTSREKANQVLSVNPAPGATVALDTQITITYSPGTGIVPNFVTYTKTGAQALADREGWTVTFVEEATSSAPAGQVFRQNPDAGTEVKRTTRITLVLAKTPAQQTPSPSETPTPSVSPSTSSTP